MGGQSHTAGPWERLEGVVEVGHPIYKPGTVVTRIVQKRERGQAEFIKVALVDTGSANARLIAAAPELLEALIFADETFAGLSWDADGPTRKPIRAAIAKATGESAE